MDQQPPPSPEAAGPAAPARPGGMRGFYLDFLGVLRFFSRLPVPSPTWDPDPHAPPDFAGSSVFTVPLAGAIIGAIGAAVGWLALKLGLSPVIAAILAIGTLCAVTGCLHEDGLADCCDGFFGGSTPERRREIMKDSRLGTFGVVGLVISLPLRVAALAEILRVAGSNGAWLLIGIAALSRVFAFMPAGFSAPASHAGLAGSKPNSMQTPFLAILWLGVPYLNSPRAFGLVAGAIGGLVLALLATYLLSRLARVKIGGYTGDVLGAAQQVAEITLLLGLAAAAGWT